MVGAVFLGPGAGRAHACSCAGSPSSTDELYWPDAVFAGEVIDVEEDTSGGMPPLSPVTLGVEESWKGASEERVVVRGYGPVLWYASVGRTRRSLRPAPEGGDASGTRDRFDREPLFADWRRRSRLAAPSKGSSGRVLLREPGERFPVGSGGHRRGVLPARNAAQAAPVTARVPLARCMGCVRRRVVRGSGVLEKHKILAMGMGMR